MLKTIIRTVFSSALVLATAGVVFAASPVSIRLEQPGSPTNHSSFNIVFVTLDTQSRAMTVKCFKKGPSEASFAQFGGDISLSAGGNTGNCSVSGLSDAGTYSFKATAQAGADSAESSVVSVDYNNSSGPGTPTNYSKSKITDCVWRISFKTADDGGKTVKVKLYRNNSDSDLTSTTQVDSQNIGSNTDGHFDYTAPDCSKTYYFALRAFDSFGNESGTVGDTIDQTTTVNPTSAPSGSGSTGGTTGAIPVRSGAAGGQVLGEKTSATSGKTTGEVKGESTTPTLEPSVTSEPLVSPTEAPKETTQSAGIFSPRNLGFVVIVVVAAGLIYFILKRKPA